MKKLMTIAAIFAFTGAAFAEDGHSVLDNVNAALNASGNYSSTSYQPGVGSSVLDDAVQIARIETLSAPVAIGDVDRLFNEDSAIGSLFQDE